MTDPIELLVVPQVVIRHLGHPAVAEPHRSTTVLGVVRLRGCQILVPELPHGWLAVMEAAHPLMQRAGRHLLGEWMEVVLHMLGIEHLRMSLLTPLPVSPTNTH